MKKTEQLIVRQLGLKDYQTTWQLMQDFTQTRDDNTADELWWVEHPSVFTQGQAGKAEHLLVPGDIPVVQADRGGQVTYHGPGQLVGYTLINIRRKGIGVRQLVNILENSIVNILKPFNIEAYPKADAPGVYVDNCKIASLGLRIRRGCSFHGLALNVNMDLSPFLRINPCGYQGLQMTQTSQVNGPDTTLQASQLLTQEFKQQLAYQELVEKVGFDNE
ncbi:lipoyl(octanoyl) transferase LipB [Catenovulum adriaticum]|uniref:Octanoyltransferase n=1 Tax=Catenovulum adriaticum TaxID=2984846 RepID=A0ABY7ANA5_9ALTE|nr:lipoyl(octanoyl) transferase LipB [Catenovulum sp. TS8]WAJ70626.1 lipoyl(octanoyl) transferase LipB [Catenovulum sp. TS8]